MGNLRTYTVTSMITALRYELRDTSETYRYTNAELTAYINKIAEAIHLMLINKESDLVRTGTGTITTVAGTQSYDLDSNSMGDLWVPHRIWVDEYEPMEPCEEWELFDGINAEERSETGHRTRPDHYYLEDDDIWFKEVPDDAYTVRFKYFPNYTLLSYDDDDQIGFRNIYNQDIIEGVKILAKNRNELDIQVDSLLKDFFENLSNKIMERRRYRDMSLKPAKRSYRRGRNYGRIR